MKKLLLAASVAAISISGVAMAGGGAMSAMSGLYVEGGLGYVKQDVPSASDLGYASKDDKNIGGRVAVGYGYNFDPAWSLGGEVGWGYYGKADYDTPGSASLKTTAFDIAAVGTWHINPAFSLFAKAGMAYEDLNGKAGGNGLGDNTAWKPLLGIGAGYNFMPNLQVNVTYTHVFGDDINASSGNDVVPKLDSFLVGLRYMF